MKGDAGAREAGGAGGPGGLGARGLGGPGGRGAGGAVGPGDWGPGGQGGCGAWGLGAGGRGSWGLAALWGSRDLTSPSLSICGTTLDVCTCGMGPLAEGSPNVHLLALEPVA